MFKKGQSGNPSGRPAIDKETRAIIRKNGEKGAQRLFDILHDDEAFGAEGWLSGKEQIAVASLAQERSFGRAESVSITHTHSGTIGMEIDNHRLKQISERLPERIAQAKDAIIIEGSNKLKC